MSQTVDLQALKRISIAIGLLIVIFSTFLISLTSASMDISDGQILLLVYLGRIGSLIALELLGISLIILGKR